MQQSVRERVQRQLAKCDGYEILESLFDIEPPPSTRDCKSIARAILATGAAPEEIVEALDAMERPSASLTAESLKLMESRLRSIERELAPPSTCCRETEDFCDDASSRVRIVFEESCKRWEVAVVDDLGAKRREAAPPRAFYEGVKEALKGLQTARDSIKAAGRDCSDEKVNLCPETAAQIHARLLFVTELAGGAQRRARCLLRA